MHTTTKAWMVFWLVAGSWSLGQAQTPGKLKWEFERHWGSQHIIGSHAIGADGMIYAGTSSGYVYALNAETGAEIWQFMTPAGWDNFKLTVGPDGTVYAASRSGRVFALHGATGKQVWKKNLNELAFTSPAISKKGVLYVGSYRGGLLYALDSKTGKKMWTFKMIDALETQPAIGPDDTVYFGTRRKLYAVDGESGLKKWEFDGWYFSAPVFGHDGTVYTSGSMTCALNGQTGTVKWETDIATGAVIVGNDNRLYVGGHENVSALDSRTGDLIWRSKAWIQRNATPAIASDGTIYVGSSDNKVYALNGENGTPKWLFETDHWTTEPLIGDDGTVFVVAVNKLIALHGSTGPADSAWPMAGQNGRRTSTFSDWSFLEDQPVKVSVTPPQEAAVGYRVEFTSSTWGMPPFEYQWKKDGVAIEGETRSVLIIEEAQMSDSGKYSVEVIHPGGSTSSASTRLTVNPFLPGDLKWEFKAGSDVQSSPALGTDGTVYFGSHDKKVYALKGETGELKWSVDTGHLVTSSPAIGRDGTVYIGSWDKKIYALNGQTGEEQWRIKTGGPVKASAAIGVDGTVYIGSFDKVLYALNGRTGEKKWALQTGGRILATPAIGENDLLYIRSEGTYGGAAAAPARIHAVNIETGIPEWGVDSRTDGGQSSVAIGLDGAVYVVGGPAKSWGNNNSLLCLDAMTGEQRWAYESSSIIRSSPVIGSDGTVYISDERYGFHALDGRTGRMKWEARHQIQSTAAVAADGTVYLGAGRTVHALDGNTGDARWKTGFGDSVRSSPVIGNDGTVYFGASNGAVYACYGTVGPAHSPWPMLGQNAQRTSNVWKQSQQTSPPFHLNVWSRAATELTGRRVELIGSAMGAAPLRFQWKKNGQPIEGANTNRWIIDSSEIDDSGNYTVEVINAFGTRESDPFRLTIRKPMPGDLKWELEFEGSHNSAPAIGPDGTLYVGANGGGLIAIDGQTRSMKWKPTGTDLDVTSPVIGTDGTVYFGSWGHKVYAFNGQTGAKKWEFQTGWSVPSPPAIGVDDTVYIGSHDKKVYALNGQTGAKKWEFTTKGSIVASPAIGRDGTVYIGSVDGFLYALDGQSGKKRWEFDTGSKITASAAIGADGTVYFGAVKKVCALYGRTGDIRWIFESPRRSFGSPVIGEDGTIYIGAKNNELFALDGITGTRRWVFKTDHTVSSTPAVSAGGTVYIGSNWNHFYAVDGANGKKKWEVTTDGWGWGSPVIGVDGTVYFETNRGKIYAYYGDAGPADSSWPMVGQNAQRTRNIVQPIRLIISHSATLPVTFTFATSRGHTYEVQASSDLVAWRELTTIEGTSGEAQFTDTRKARFPRQYYRVKRTE